MIRLMTTDQALETWGSLIQPRLSERPSNSKTVKELANAAGVNRRTMQERINKLLETGKLEKHLVAGIQAPVYTIRSVQENDHALGRRRKR